MSFQTVLTPAQIGTYTSQGFWVNRVITDYLDEAAARTPGKVAFIDRRRQITFAELKREADHCALGLAELGVRPGDVVSFQLPNWIEWIIVHYAATRIGAVSNPLIPIYRERELNFMVGLAKPRVMVIPASFRGFDYPGMIARLEAPAPQHVLVVDGEPGQGTQSWADFMATPWQERRDPASLPGLRPDPNEVTLLIFTSGTTGEPKGVMHTHNTVHDLLSAPNLAAHDLTSLVRFCCMGAPIPRVLVREAKQKLPGLTVLGGWGQSENGLVTLGVPGDPEEKIFGTDGCPWPGMRIRVVDFDGRELAAGTEGRLQVAGPFLFAGYAERLDMTRACFDYEWFDTGDLARIDGGGYLNITGRTRDVIIRGGENIPVAYVENVLYENPAIEAAAVVAVPDPRLRDTLKERALSMDLTLTDEQRSFRAAAREFLDAEVVPYRQEWDRREAVDTAIVPRLGEMGFFGLTIPPEYGGLGGDYITYCLGMEELGRADSAVRGIVSVSMGLVGKSILAHGSEEQKQRWLPRIATGQALGCFGLTEPDTGSDAASLRTAAVRDGDGYVITGQKMFITNGTWADVCLLFARTGGPGPRGVTAFLVPTDSPGFEAREIKGKLGLRGQATAELFLSGVRVPAAARLGADGEGFRIAMESLDKGRVTVAAGCVGIIQGCLETVVGYARERSQFGRPLGSFQLIQDMIAEISVDADAARLLAWRAAGLIERGEPYRVAASKAKYFASEAAVRASNQAVQALGGYGYIDEYPAQKYLRDARVMTLYEGTSQIQKLLIGRAETGISAFT